MSRSAYSFQITQRIPLGQGRMVKLRLPVDLNLDEAQHLCQVLMLLARGPGTSKPHTHQKLCTFPTGKLVDEDALDDEELLEEGFDISGDDDEFSVQDPEEFDDDEIMEDRREEEAVVRPLEF